MQLLEGAFSKRNLSMLRGATGSYCTRFRKVIETFSNLLNEEVVIAGSYGACTTHARWRKYNPSLGAHNVLSIWQSKLGFMKACAPCTLFSLSIKGAHLPCLHAQFCWKPEKRGATTAGSLSGHSLFSTEQKDLQPERRHAAAAALPVSFHGLKILGVFKDCESLVYSVFSRGTM